jgi:hypothetical protein
LALDGNLTNGEPLPYPKDGDRIHTKQEEQMVAQEVDSIKYLATGIIWKNEVGAFGFTPAYTDHPPKHFPFDSIAEAKTAFRKLAKSLKQSGVIRPTFVDPSLMTSDRREFGYVEEIEGFKVDDVVTVEGYDEPGVITEIAPESNHLLVEWSRAWGWFGVAKLTHFEGASLSPDGTGDEIDRIIT